MRLYHVMRRGSVDSIYNFDKNRQYDNKYLLQMESIINNRENLDEATGYPNLIKMQQCGELIKKHVDANNLHAIFCANIILNTEDEYALGGVAAHSAIWKAILDEFAKLLPANAYLGHSKERVVIYYWGDIDSIEIEKISNQVSRSLSLLKLTRKPLVTHTRYIIYPQDCGKLSNYSQIIKRVASISASAELNPVKPTIERFNTQLYKDMQYKLLEEKELISCVLHGNFELYYQGQYQLDNDMIIGAEALCRFKGKYLLKEKTYEYIKILENSPYITNFTQISFEKLMEFYGKYNKYFPKDFKLSFNLSPAIFYWSDFSFYNLVKSYTDKFPMLNKHLTLEITESAYYSREIADEMIGAIKKLHKIGISIAVDDIGSGYGAMRLLSTQLISEIKLDRKMTLQYIERPGKSSYLDHFVDFMHRSGIALIFEGVETVSQKEFLLKHKIEYAQGYLYARPVEEHEFVNKYLKCSTIVDD